MVEDDTATAGEDGGMGSCPDSSAFTSHCGVRTEKTKAMQNQMESKGGRSRYTDLGGSEPEEYSSHFSRNGLRISH